MGGNGVICKHSTEDLSLRENREPLCTFSLISFFQAKVHLLHSAVGL